MPNDIDISEEISSEQAHTISDSLPPLLRGIGMTIFLIGTIIVFIVARRDVQAQRLKRESASTSISANHSGQVSLDTLAREVEELKSEVHEETVVEEVIENPWFEWIGFVGTAIVASSFYVEWLIRRKNHAY